MTVDRSMFRQYDIRGEVDRGLTPEVVHAIGQAFVRYAQEKTTSGAPSFAIGRDVRISSPSLAAALIKGINEAGGDVIDIGVVPTPVLYYALFTLAVDGGIMITGSHNPPQYNGLKLALNRETLYGSEIQQVADLMDNTGAAGARSGIASPMPLLASYRDDLAFRFGMGILGKADKPRLKVVVDCANGCAGLVVPWLLERLGIDAISLYAELDGTFPNHHPDPARLDTLASLQKQVLAEHADVGIAYDGDVDRIGVVDEKGEVVWGDKLVYIFAADIVAHWKGPGRAKVIGEVKCSKTLFDGVARLGGQAIMSPTGHSLIKKMMREQKAQLAGEMSGHMFFADRYYGYDDAIYATLRLLEILAQTRKQRPDAVFSDLLAPLPPAVASPEFRRPCREEDKQRLVQGFGEAFRENFPAMAASLSRVVTIDGVRLEWPYGWGLVRASNTEPILVLRFEAATQEQLTQIQTAFEETLKVLGSSLPEGGR